MTTSINTNVSAYFAQNNLRSASAAAQSSIARLSSGNRIIRASDDVAALSIGTVLRTDVSTLKTALSNTAQAGSLIQVADGALQRLGEILQRQKALATQGNADTLSDTERGYLNQEFQALVSEYDRIVSKTNFNGIGLLNGNLASSTTTLATEDTTISADSIGRLGTGLTLDTTVLGANGNGTIEITNNGTTVGNATQQKLIGSLATATVGVIGTTANNVAYINININGTSFTSGLTTINAAANDVTFTADDGSGVTFTLDIADQSSRITTGSTVTAAEGLTVAALIQTEIRKFDFYADKVLENTAATDSSAITAAKFDGTVLAGLSGANFQLVGKAFSTTNGKAPAISGFEVKSISTTLASFTVKIGGTTYSSSKVTGNETGVVVDADISGNNLGGGTGIVRLVSADDANSYLDINLTATTSAGVISLTTQSAADGIAAALNGAFGSGASGGASFQVGTDSDDVISVAINNVDTASVYKDSAGASQTLSVGTKANSIIASGALDNAINTVTSVRAQVGAIQSRFNFAASTLETSVQNLDAARAGFLDADISNESTAFASQQVLIQASISVLAQANQLPQNLLKLIG